MDSSFNKLVCPKCGHLGVSMGDYCDNCGHYLTVEDFLSDIVNVKVNKKEGERNGYGK